VEKYCRAGQTTDDDMAHAHCMLDTQGYKHLLRICNTHCSSTTTVVARTPLNITFYVHCLSSLGMTETECLLRGTDWIFKYSTGLISPLRPQFDSEQCVCEIRGTGTGFCPNVSVFSVSVIPPTLCTHLHLRSAVGR
jgi:hypothetical protein